MERVTKENVLDQKLLRRVEALCTQEQPPACVAACPLHVDARGMSKAIAAGDWAAAYAMYAKAVPFPEIVSRCCDAPCERVCKRTEIGGAIRIRDLERAATAHAKQPRRPPLFLPKRSESVAIVGGGLRGVTAAFDLAKKGIRVTVWEATERLGGSLWEIARDVLPESAMEDDFAVLHQKYPIAFCMGQAVDLSGGEALDAWREAQGFDAVFVACESLLAGDANENTLATKWPRLFAGRRRRFEAAAHSPISDIYDGRSAATSIERALRAVSLTAGREGEGGFTTTLYTKLDAIEAAPPILASGEEGYSREEAQREAERCIQCECLECVKGCAFLRHYKSYPKRYVREVYNNLSISMGTHHANGMINACSLCGQCGSICPNGLNMADIFLAARHKMVTTEKMPPSAHEFALLDTAYSNSDAAFLARHQPGCESSAYLFFPSCQLAASEPSIVEAAYADLCARLSGGVGLMLGCCGITERWAGRDDLYRATIDKLRSHWDALGKPRIIAACPSCLSTLRDEIDPDASGIWAVYEDEALPDGAVNGRDAALFVHDACGTRHDGAVQSGIRTLATRMGYRLEEGPYTGEVSPCCGYGGLTPIANREVADEMAAFAAVRSEGRSESRHLTYCVNCRDRFLAQGKDATHLLELLFGDAAAKHHPPGWSERQENRASLKQRLLETLWKEATDLPEPLHIAMRPELAEKLEDRMILRREVATCIAEAEATKARFRDPKSGHFIACYRPQNVTFWVEYEASDGGYTVYNAYSHRMDFRAE